MTETPRSPIEEARHRIARWQPGETLDLAIKGLTEIPDELRELETLETLILGDGDRHSVVTDLGPLTQLSALQSLDLSHTQVSDLGPLAQLSALQSLDLRGTRVSDLGPLAQLSALQSLDLSHTQVSDLGPLAQMSALQSLDLRGSQVSDLGPLAQMSALQSLDLSGTKVSDLGPLAQMSALQSLNLSGTQVSDLGRLAQLSALQSLYLSGTEVSDLGPLAQLSALQSLNLSNTEVSDLGPLAQLSALQSLYLSGTKVSDLGPLAQLSALQSLDLSYTQVSDLGPLAQLSALQSLDLGDTEVSDLGPLAQLSALQSLYLSDTQASDLGPLAQLSALQSLDLSDTQVSDLGPLAQLSALQSLYLSRTRVSDLGPLAQLSALQSLDLIRTQVSDLGPLAQLSALQSLDLIRTQVSDLGPLAQLSALQSLDLISTQVSDIGPLAGCEQLDKIKISFCSLSAVPSELWESSALQEVIAYDTEISGLPTELLSKYYSDNCLPAIRAHLRDFETGVEPMRDAKLLVLGNGRVGKTQICLRLLEQDYDDTVDSTHGITVSGFPLKEAEGAPRLQLWDFGGQDIYHGTHALFMKSRGIFIAAWTPEAETAPTHVHNGMTFRNKPLPWWLRQIAEFAGTDAPVIAVQTQADMRRDAKELSPEARERLEAFATHDQLSYSALKPRNHDGLLDAITEAYETLDKPLIGKVRADAKAALESDERRSLTMDEFHELCAEKGGVFDPALFLDFLHQCGTVFYREGLFEGRIIVDQQWAIRAIYAVLDRESQTYKIIRSRGGAFSRMDLGLLQWDDDYSPDDQQLFLTMMQSCGICFEHRHGNGEVEAEYIAPDLLPETHPVAGVDSLPDDALFATRRYAHLPDSLIRSVISTVGQHAGTQGDYWRSGLAVREAKLDSRCVIVARPEPDGSGCLEIRTHGGAAADFLDRLVGVVSGEETRLGLRPLGFTGPDHSSQRSAAPTPDYAREAVHEELWFFSYANADETKHGGPVAAFCDMVQERLGVTVRRDTEELTYGAVIETFMDEMARTGKRVFIWLTDAYLRSPYCMYELHEIWRYWGKDPAEFEARVVVLRGDAKIRLPEERRVYRAFWQRQFVAAQDEVARGDTSDEVFDEQKRCKHNEIVTGSILRKIDARVRFADFDTMLNHVLSEGRSC